MALNSKSETSLAKKGLWLLLPCAFVQIVLLFFMLVVYQETEFYALRAAQDKEVADNVRTFVFDGLATLRCARRLIEGITPDPPVGECDRLMQKFAADGEQLCKDWSEFAQRRARIVTIKDQKKLDDAAKDLGSRPAWVRAVTTTMAQAVQSAKQFELWRQSGAAKSDLSGARPSARRLWGAAQSGLYSFVMYQDGSGVDPPQSQSRIRTYSMIFMITASALNLFLLLFLGFSFSRDVIDRLRIMLENTQRLAGDQFLLPLVKGTDEIARVDSVFHEMAQTLTKNTHAHKAMLDNAQDVICSLDNQGRFVAVSAAVEKVFATSADKLLGMPLIDSMEANDQPVAAQKLLDAVSSSQNPFEIKMLRPNGTSVDILMSVNYSKQDRSYFCVAHDISEIKRARRLQQELVQMVSHDLRSPLSALSHFHDLLETGMLGRIEEDGFEQINTANRIASHMLTLINQLLDFDRLESGMLELDRVECKLSDIMERAFDSVRAFAENEGVEVVYAGPSEIMMYADEHRLIQVIVNLVSNAIKFSTRGKRVIVDANKSAIVTEIRVSDQGRGIPEDKLGFVFDRFSQVKASDATAKGGSGLGLSICKALVELHGGDISVESQEGKGSVFSFRIPNEGAKP